MITKLLAFLKTNFKVDFLVAGILVILLIILFRSCSCGPKPVTTITSSNKVVTDDSTSKVIDSLRQVIKTYQIQLSLAVPNSDTVSAILSTTNNSGIVNVVTDRIDGTKDTIKVVTLGTDSCPSLILDQLLKMEGNEGTYHITGIVSCKTGYVYDLHIDASGIVMFDSSFADTLVSHYVHVYQNTSKTTTDSVRLNTITTPGGLVYSLYTTAYLDPYFTPSARLTVGATIGYNKIDFGLEPYLYMPLKPIGLDGGVNLLIRYYWAR